MPDYRQVAREAACRHGIDPALYERQINAESGFDPSAVSPAGAIGIAQIMPQYHPDVDPHDPYASLDYAAILMSRYVWTYNNDYALALAAYNAGPARVDEALGRGKSRWWALLPQETIAYIRRILIDW